MRESPDDDAQDYIFLLSTYEAERIFSDDKQRIAFLDNSLSDTRNPSKPLSWWLRSKGSYDVHAARVSWLGEIKEYGSPVNSSLGVRPAMMISY